MPPSIVRWTYGPENFCAYARGSGWGAPLASPSRVIAGTAMTGAVKSAMGLGYLLSQGIGDTLRVSLAADPVEEVKVGFEILKSLELRHRGINVIACPTCGRVEIDVVRMANELEKKLGHIKTPMNVSVLGCVVNGIGEGKEADIGIAGGEGKGILFKKGKLVRKVPIEELMDVAPEGWKPVRWAGRNLYFGGVSAVERRPDGTLAAAGDPRRGGHGIVVG